MKGIQYDYLRVSVLYFNPIFVFVLFFLLFFLFVCGIIFVWDFF